MPPAPAQPTSKASGQDFLHERVAERIRGLIRDGTLRPGDRAPSLRRVRRQFDVSMATATRAYERLEQAGWLEAHPQSGFYVRRAPGSALAPPARGHTGGHAERVDTAALARELVPADGIEPDAVTLSLALPDQSLLPTKALQRSMTRVARTDMAATTRYAFAPGVEALRRPIAYRALEAGCRVHPDDVLITSGCAEALTVALHATTRPGATVAVESPTFFNFLALLETLDRRVLEVPTDPQAGIDLDALEGHLAAGTVDAVLVTPNFSNPIGSCMPASGKRHLAELAARFAVPVIEDDIYGELFFGGQRPTHVRAFDDSGQVLTASSFSKTIAPGYRVGWLLPGAYREAASAAKQALSVATATLPQLAIADFLESGGFERHLRHLRRQYRDQVERMRDAIARALPPGTRATAPEGGFLLWVELPDGLDGLALYHEALRAGVRIAPGRLFSTAGEYDRCIRISCGLPWDDTVEAAIRRLGDAAHRLAHDHSRQNGLHAS